MKLVQETLKPVEVGLINKDSRPLMVAVDIDGTLMNDGLVVSSHNQREIQKAVNNGIRVILATGRMYKSALTVAINLGLRTPIISYNGAMIRSEEQGILAHTPIPRAVAEEIILFLRRAGIFFLAFVNDRVYSETIDARNQLYEAVSGVQVEKVKCLVSLLDKGDPTKLLVIEDNYQLEKSRRALSNVTAFEKIRITKSRPMMMEIVQGGVNKGKAMSFLTAHYGIPLTRAAAIGDSENDLEMLDCCSISIAMGNAIKEVKMKASYITKTNNEDGVAWAFKNYIF